MSRRRRIQRQGEILHQSQTRLRNKHFILSGFLLSNLFYYDIRIVLVLMLRILRILV
jgi:hypothetical protein